jgi:putative ABC transport system ATP-binding protein
MGAEINAIEVTQLSKRVQDVAGMLTILDDITFSLRAGDSLAITGASGSGKSTLLGLLAGLDTPTTGQVNLLGQSIFALDEDGRAALRAKHIGFVFQSFHLLPNLSALENVISRPRGAGARDCAAATGWVGRTSSSFSLDSVWGRATTRIVGQSFCTAAVGSLCGRTNGEFG